MRASSTPPGPAGNCDEFPERQKSRQRDQVNFTGEKFIGKSTCPSELARPLDTIELWPGNRKSPPIDDNA
jgi:hypothetical protein